MAWTFESTAQGKRIGTYTDTWTGDSSTTTDADTQEPFSVLSIAISYRDSNDNPAVITNNATVTIDTITGENYDHVISTFLNGAGVTDNHAVFEENEVILSVGDRLKVACNAGGDNAYCTIKVVLP